MEVVTENIMEQQTPLPQDELMAAESALHKEKAARKEAQLRSKSASPPGLRASLSSEVVLPINKKACAQSV